MGRHKKEQTVVVYARIPEQLAADLREEAYKDGRELSATIRLILENRHTHDGGLEIIPPKPRITQRREEEIPHSVGEIDALEPESAPEREVSHYETETQPSTKPKEKSGKPHSRQAKHVSHDKKYGKAKQSSGNCRHGFTVVDGATMCRECRS
jgi:hypothetical protein